MAIDHCGIDDGYRDSSGAWRATSARTRAAVLAAMGVAPSSEPLSAADVTVRVVRQGEPIVVLGAAEVTLEDGSTLGVHTVLPADLPLGYHELRTADPDVAVRLIVAPTRCHLPVDRRAWGWAVQLYAARSRRSWGIGDLGDLERLSRWSRELGAGVILLNPLNAAVPRAPENPSPYSPSSRRYRHPIYVRIEDVPGASARGAELDERAAAGRALNGQRRIDRDEVGRLKRDALERLWRRFRGDADFDRYRKDEGQALTTFAVFSALAEHHGRVWRAWPPEYGHPAGSAVARFAVAAADRVRFHEWTQWLLDRQLERAARHVALVHDFPVGVDPDGADAWAWQDLLALGMSVGAPPDRYTPRGQDWGLPPFIPHRLRAERYEPFIQAIRGTLRHGGGLRIDHVMGLFRLFWVPRGFEPADGAYVRYPADDLLGIVALESHRARAFVIGEDLGTVEHGVRERLAAHSVLSTRVVWFESEPPERYPELALAAVGTHDLPTIAGVWSGADVDAQMKLGLRPNAEAYAEQRRRLGRLARVPDDADVEHVIVGAYQALARAPARIVTATLDDALAVAERPNMPGTTVEWPNWSLALPAPLETLETSALTRRVAAALGAERPRSTPAAGVPPSVLP
jgi:4-alpha-glucanotransferase